MQKSSYLYEEPVFLLHQELREPSAYNSILTVLNTLMENGAFFDFRNKYYVIFSKSGFTKKVMEFAKVNDNILLFTMEDFAQNF